MTHDWVDAGFEQNLAVHGAVSGNIEIVKRSDARPGFVPIRKRCIVGQVHGTLMLHRRLVPEYESRPESSVSHTPWAPMANMARRLTDSSTPTRRHGQRPPVRLETILGLITEREATAPQTADRLREQVTALTSELPASTPNRPHLLASRFPRLVTNPAHLV